MQDSKIALDAAFKPKSVAIIGASNSFPKIGAVDLKILKDFGYKGEIYPVNPKDEFVQGYKAYKSVKDIPNTVDRAVIALPSKFVPQAIKECGEKGVKVVQIYSAGFGEFGEEGKKIEANMLSMARKYGMRIIGPNCIGTYCSSGGLNFTNNKSTIPGTIAFVSQSGGIAIDMVYHGDVTGIDYSKVISVGNCIDLDHPDYLEYLGNDPDTKAIGLYIESVKDGQRFMKALKQITPHKPVVILKGGRTESGSESVASHTGSLAGNYNIWETIFEQTGVMAVQSIGEMVVALKSIQDLQTSPNSNIAIAGNGGGATVLATDVSDELGLEFAVLSEETIETLLQSDIAEGGRNVNPIDLPVRPLIEKFPNIMKAYSCDKNITNIIIHINLLPISKNTKGKEEFEETLRGMFESIPNPHEIKKNIVIALRTNGDPYIEEIKLNVTRLYLSTKGIPVFSTIEQALFAVQLMVEQGKRTSKGGYYENNTSSDVDTQ